MTTWFKSDNTSRIAPQMLDAIHRANDGYAFSYGDDEWSARLDAAYSSLFETTARVFPVPTGTAANALALATLAPPWGCIYAHGEAHIVRDECGAPEFMSGGARVVELPGEAARIDPGALRAAVSDNPANVHTLQPAAVSITQSTELGVCYRPGDIAALSVEARAHGLKLHMDGARFANAIAFLGCSPAAATWRAGVDVLSFGATKNGGLGAEAVIFFDTALARDFEFRRKRAGHLLSKMRYTSAQLLAYVEDGLWLRLAARANELAARIGEAAGSWLMHPVEANEVFVRLGAERIAALRAHAADFRFYDWGAANSGEARFVVSWDQPEQQVELLAGALRTLR
jgi:threonine aldolase